MGLYTNNGGNLSSIAGVPLETLNEITDSIPEGAGKDNKLLCQSDLVKSISKRLSYPVTSEGVAIVLDNYLTNLFLTYDIYTRDYELISPHTSHKVLTIINIPETYSFFSMRPVVSLEGPDKETLNPDIVPVSLHFVNEEEERGSTNKTVEITFFNFNNDTDFNGETLAFSYTIIKTVPQFN